MRNDRKFITKVRNMTEKEGMTITEIANSLNCSEITIKRVRKENNIGKRNLSKRKDKTYICLCCKKEVLIRREEPRRLMCPECRIKHKEVKL